MGLHKTRRVNQGMHVPEVDMDIIVREIYGKRKNLTAVLEIRTQDGSTHPRLSRDDPPLLIRPGFAIDLNDEQHSASAVRIHYDVDRGYSLIETNYEQEKSSVNQI